MMRFCLRLDHVTSCYTTCMLYLCVLCLSYKTITPNTFRFKYFVFQFKTLNLCTSDRIQSCRLKSKSYLGIYVEISWYSESGYAAAIFWPLEFIYLFIFAVKCHMMKHKSKRQLKKSKRLLWWYLNEKMGSVEINLIGVSYITNILLHE